MQIIDFHTHIFPDDLAPRAMAALQENAQGVEVHSDGTLRGLRESMKKNGIGRSVLLPIATKPSQVPTINNGCKDLLSEDCTPFGTFHPDAENIAGEIDRLTTLHIKGIKLHPEYQAFYIDEPRIFSLYEALSDAGLIVVFHAGKDPGPFTNDHALPAAFKTVYGNFPRLKMVVSHMGGWLVWDEVEMLLVDLPVFFDTAAVREFLPAAQFLRITRRHGTDRVLFGSDSPWYDQGEDVRWIDSMDLASEEKERIFHKNAEALLNL